MRRFLNSGVRTRVSLPIKVRSQKSLFMPAMMFFFTISVCQIDLEPYVENPSIETYRDNNTHCKDIMGWMTMNHIHH